MSFCAGKDVGMEILLNPCLGFFCKSGLQIFQNRSDSFSGDTSFLFFFFEVGPIKQLKWNLWWQTVCADGLNPTQWQNHTWHEEGNKSRTSTIEPIVHARAQALPPGHWLNNTQHRWLLFTLVNHSRFLRVTFLRKLSLKWPLGIFKVFQNEIRRRKLH